MKPNANILIANGCSIATTTLYRVTHLQEQLAALGHSVTVQDWTRPEQIWLDEIDGFIFNDFALLDYDLVIFYRTPVDKNIRLLIEKLRGAGIPTLFDVDDLVFEPRLIQWHRGVQRLSDEEQGFYAEGVERYAATLNACDYTMTATPFLAELARKHGKKAFVHRNALGQEMQALADKLYQQRDWRDDDAAAERIVIGYGSGTPTHDVDFMQCVPALLDVMARYPAAQLWLAGPLILPAELEVFKHRIRRYPLMEWQEWFQLLAQFDINLAPLEMGNLFCRAKSEIKFVEAGAMGVPTVASRVDAFSDAITPWQDGILVANENEWVEALDALLQSSTVRQEIGERARATVQEHYTIPARTKNLEQILAAISEDRTAPGNQSLNGNRMSGSMSGGTPKQEAGHVPTPSLPARSAATEATEQDAEEHTGSKAEPPLVINWLVSEPIVGSGGHIGIFRMIKFLTDFGHECHIYILAQFNMFDFTTLELQEFVERNFFVTGGQYHKWTGRVLDADVTVATYWETVYEAEKLANGGPRYYFVQDFEPFFYPMGTTYIRAENTYRKGFHCITLGSWLAKLMRDRYGATADHFNFAINQEIYYPRPVEQTSPRIAFYARPSTPRRAYEIGIEALQLVKMRQPNVEIVLFGANELTPTPEFEHTNLGILTPYELAALYSTCQIGLVLSLTNPSFVPFEMMACRCAVVDIRNEQTEDLFEHGKNALLAEPTPEGLAAAVVKLLQDPPLRNQLIEEGYRHVNALTWQDSARQIEAILLKNSPPESRLFVQRRQQGEVSTLLWQINRLLDDHTDHQAEIDQLRSLLYRVLAEKAVIATQLQHTGQLLQQTRTLTAYPPPSTGWQGMLEKINMRIRFWTIGSERVYLLPLNGGIIQQTFQADRSHLCRIELWFAPVDSLRIGTLRLQLHDDIGGSPVCEQIVYAGEIRPDVPQRLYFAPQADSYAKQYTLRIQLSEPDFPSGLALLRYPRTYHKDGVLRQDGQKMAGELVFQAFYGEPDGIVQPGRSSPPNWTTPPRFAVMFANDRLREGIRLSTKVYDVMTTHGVSGLVDEVFSYINWQLSHRQDSG